MRRTILGLGLATIVAYGTWFYAFGALIDTIAADTGWPVGFIAGAFGAAQLIGAAGAIAGGRMLDRFGIRPVLMVGGIAGGTFLALSPSGGRVVFGLAFAAGGALIEATGFYHVTLSAAARFEGDRRVRTVTAVTIIGALAGPIFLPLTAALAEGLGWRPAVRILGVIAILGLCAAAVAVPSGLGGARSTSPRALRPAITRALADPASRLKLFAAPLAAIGYSILLVYQVPVMVAAGVPLATAAAYGGARGLLQIVGRVGLIPVVERIGVGTAYALTLLVGGVAAIVLSASSVVTAAVSYVILAGIAIGAASALDAIFGAEVYEPSDLGTLMGLQQLLAGTAGALAPFIAGLVFDAAGNHAFTITLSACGFAAATIMILATDRAMRRREAPGPPPYTRTS